MIAAERNDATHAELRHLTQEQVETVPLEDTGKEDDFGDLLRHGPLLDDTGRPPLAVRL
jgi:hypothetical protein